MKFKFSFKIHSDLLVEGTRNIIRMEGLSNFKVSKGTLAILTEYDSNANWRLIPSNKFISGWNSISLDGNDESISLTINDYTYELPYYIEEQNPILTANGTLGGNTNACAASHESQPAWWAFDGDTTTSERCWWTQHGQASISNPCWITYYYPTATKLSTVKIENEVATPASTKTGVVQGSNDNSSWTDLAEIHIPNNDAGYVTTINVNSNTAYKYFRLYFTDGWSYEGISIQEIELISKYSGYPTIKTGNLETYQSWMYLKDINALKLED